MLITGRPKTDDVEVLSVASSSSVMKAASVGLLTSGAVRRFGLAISLASVAAVLGVTGSVAYKLLASRRSARGPVALPGKQGQEASLIESPKSKAEPIPIGAAWQEVENRTPAENAPSTQVIQYLSCSLDSQKLSSALDNNKNNGNNLIVHFDSGT